MHPLDSIRARLGLQILFDFKDIGDAIRFASRHGFGALELNLGNIRFGQQLASRRERRRIAALALDHGIVLAFHALEGPSFFIPSRRAFQATVSELKQTLDYAADVGARNVVMHLGFDMHYGIDGGNRYTHEEFPEYFVSAMHEGLTQLKAYARDRSRLCVENVGGFRYGPAAKVLPQLLGGSLGLCYDVGHTNILPANKRRHELAFFRRFRQHIHHTHIHDNNGVRDEHHALGKGSMDFLRIFRFLLNTDALLVFEVRPKEAALRSLDYFNRKVAPNL
ncbi:MAG: sugar phosphate isomerase/epimerase [candidate division WOR-3 bacterium]